MLSFRRKVLIGHFAALAIFGLILGIVGGVQDIFLRLFWDADVIATAPCILGKYWSYVSVGILLLYGALMGSVFLALSRPLQQIIDAIRLQEKTGELPRINLNASLLQEEFSQLALLLNSLTERIETQIRRLQQQKKDTEEVLQSLNEGIIAVDRSGKIDFINQTALNMLDVETSILGNVLLASQTEPTSLLMQCHELVLQVLQTFEMSEQRWVGKDKKGELLHLNLSATCRIGQNGAILVLQDQTSNFKMLDMGKDFIANASHELKTPITIIQGFAETLQDHPNLPPEMLSAIATKIVRTSCRLDKLVKGLLTLADIENFSLENLQTVDIASLAIHCKELLLASNPKALVEIAAEEKGIFVAADPILLDLALINLLENAVKYSAPPPKIELLLEVKKPYVHIAIRDWGIGIPEADLPHIFERFYRVDKARSRKSGGAGLGLAIAKTIIEKHQGKVTVASKMGEGSLFTVMLPLSS